LITVAVAGLVLLSGCHGSPAASGPSSSTPAPGTSATPSPVPTTTASAASCTPAQLNIVYSPTDNTAGHAHGVLTFANTSQQPCALTGYAAVTFADPSTQQPMGPQATQNATEPTGPAVASVDGFSTADLTITDAGIVEGCTVVTATALLVTPPGLTQPFVVPIDPTPACQNSSIGLLAVSSNYIPVGS
jgi:hypothetical protein